MYKIFNIANTTNIVHEALGVIPDDPLNPDYLAYVAWLFEGNVAEQWQPEQPITADTMVEDAN